VVLAVSSPGLWPSVFGRLYGQLRIEDPNDGNIGECLNYNTYILIHILTHTYIHGIGGEARYRKLYDTIDIESEGISATTNAAAVVSNAGDTYIHTYIIHT
jgi:hypothetical protein